MVYKNTQSFQQTKMDILDGRMLQYKAGLVLD